ncbi:MAG: hypothetical protein IPK26_21650 [Planctomycetes bacterium]|nr:hypothetical protein [Planctomycetota bacterium]
MPRFALLLSFLSLVATAAAQEAATATHPAATLGLADHITWRSDGAEIYDKGPQRTKAKTPRQQLLDEACATAKQEGKLVMWYVYRILEKGLGGRQMYRSPVLDLYMQQVVFGDPDVSELLQTSFVPVRCICDQELSDRYAIKPLDHVEPVIVFLDGDGKIVHLVERIRTFHGQWFADLCVRVLEHARIERKADGVDGQRKAGLWRQALATASGVADKDADDWLQIAHLQRLLRLPEQAFDSIAKAEAALAAANPANTGRRRGRRPDKLLGDVLCEKGLLLTVTGDPVGAQPWLEQASRSGAARAPEAGYWHALNLLRLGDEAGAMRRFQVVANQHPATLWGKRARANTLLGPDDRPLGAAFTGFESIAWLPDAAWQGLPRDTRWAGAALAPKPMARIAVTFLLAQQRDDGGFTDSRYAYWPSSEITPNVWVAITAIAATALLEYRPMFPELQPRIDDAVARAERFLLDPKRLNRGANEDCYSDAYRLMFFARRANAVDGAAKEPFVAHMNTIVADAAKGQKASGFWAHEYENAFATGAVLQELLVARQAGATVPSEVTDRAAAALLSARLKNGTYVYGGSAGEGAQTGLKDASGRMPVCEGTLLLLGRSDLDKVRFALENFWAHMHNLERVRRNDFHSDGELGGFFFWHSVFHASETVRLLPEAEQQAHWPKFLALIASIPEMDGSFLDSHELGRSYGTAMALLTLKNAASFE